MKVIDGRGQNTHKNKEKVRKFIEENEVTTITEIQEGTGFSYYTVRKYVNQIMEEEQKQAEER